MSDESYNKRFSLDDYYCVEREEYNPNCICDEKNTIALELTDLVDNLIDDSSTDVHSRYNLEDDSLRRFSHDAEALFTGGLSISERQFARRLTAAEDVYGGRPVWEHLGVSYGKEILQNSELLHRYDITTAISIGGVRHALLRNWYVLELSGEERSVSKSVIYSPDVVHDGVVQRYLTPFDARQAMQSLKRMKAALREQKKEDE